MDQRATALWPFVTLSRHGDVAYWHKANITTALNHVRFRG